MKELDRLIKESRRVCDIIQRCEQIPGRLREVHLAGRFPVKEGVPRLRAAEQRFRACGVMKKLLY